MLTVLAVVLALASAASYALSAVLQQREASGHVAGGAELVGRLVRSRGWWVAMGATALGAALHLAAVGMGPLLLVQPMGITALVFALPIALVRFGARVGRTAWFGVGLTVLGLPTALSAVDTSAPSGTPLLGYWGAVVAVAGLVAAAAGTARRLSRRRPGPAAVLYAVAAAAAFGLTTGTAKLVWSGGGSAAAIAAGLAAAVAGLVLAQHAYRDGGLGAPLATLTLVDPLVAGALGVVVLGEPLVGSPLRLGLGLGGVVLTAVGVLLLVPRRPVVGRPGRTAGGRIGHSVAGRPDRAGPAGLAPTLAP